MAEAEAGAAAEAGLGAEAAAEEEEEAEEEEGVVGETKATQLERSVAAAPTSDLPGRRTRGKWAAAKRRDDGPGDCARLREISGELAPRPPHRPPRRRRASALRLRRGGRFLAAEGEPVLAVGREKRLISGAA